MQAPDMKIIMVQIPSGKAVEDQISIELMKIIYQLISSKNYPPLFQDRPVQGGVIFRFRHFPYNFNRENPPNLRSPGTRGGGNNSRGVITQGYQLMS